MQQASLTLMDRLGNTVQKFKSEIFILVAKMLSQLQLTYLAITLLEKKKLITVDAKLGTSINV